MTPLPSSADTLPCVCAPSRTTIRLPGTIRRAASRAFTLVEVTIALGIASFGLISMMGLLTVGLKTAHDALNTTTEAEIAQQLANQVQLAKYSTMTATTAATPYYFTQEGLATTQANAVYFATVSAPGSLAAPGGTSSNNMKTVVITIWSNNSPQKNAIPIEIANNGS